MRGEPLRGAQSERNTPSRENVNGEKPGNNPEDIERNLTVRYHEREGVKEWSGSQDRKDRQREQ